MPIREGFVPPLTVGENQLYGVFPGLCQLLRRDGIEEALQILRLFDEGAVRSAFAAVPPAYRLNKNLEDQLTECLLIRAGRLPNLMVDLLERHGCSQMKLIEKNP